MDIVHIEDKAFMGILLAAVEAFPSEFNGKRKPRGASAEGEVHGLLFGQRITKGDSATVHNITLAVSNQIVLERTDESVNVSSVHIGRIREVTELFPTYSLLGFYHSHPFPKHEFHKTKSVDPSEVDVTSASNTAEYEGEKLLDLIIGLTRLDKKSTIVPEFPKPHIIHACCGKYKYTLSCSVATGIDDGSREYSYYPADNLICTTAAGLLYTDLA